MKTIKEKKESYWSGLLNAYFQVCVYMCLYVYTHLFLKIVGLQLQAFLPTSVHFPIPFFLENTIFIGFESIHWRGKPSSS